MHGDYNCVDHNIATLGKRENSFPRGYESSSDDEVDVDAVTEQKNLFGFGDHTKLCKFFISLTLNASFLLKPIFQESL